MRKRKDAGLGLPPDATAENFVLPLVESLKAMAAAPGKPPEPEPRVIDVPSAAAIDDDIAAEVGSIDENRKVIAKCRAKLAKMALEQVPTDKDDLAAKKFEYAMVLGEHDRAMKALTMFNDKRRLQGGDDVKTLHIIVDDASGTLQRVIGDL